MQGPAIVASISMMCLTSSLAFAEETKDAFQVTIGATVDHRLFVLPRQSEVGEAHVSGWRMSVREEDGQRIYRAERGEKVHTDRVSLSKPRNVAFNPATSRFERLAQNVRVELRYAGALDRVVKAAGGTGGKAYPMLGFALVHLPADADPVSVTKKLQRLPEVTNAWLIAKGPKKEPRSKFRRSLSKQSKLAFDSNAAMAITDETPYVSGSTDIADTFAATPVFSMSQNESETTSATVATSADSFNEWDDSDGVTLTVTLNAAAEEDTIVELSSSGTASLGGDFDFVSVGPDAAALAVSASDTVELTIEKDQESASVTLRPIRDLDEEGDETATIAISSVAGDDTNVGDASSVDVDIKDTGRLMLVDSLPDDVAELAGILSLSTTADAVEINASLANFGTVASSATTGHVEARTSMDVSEGAVLATPSQVDIGALGPSGEDFWEGEFSLELSDLSASHNYYLVFVVSAVAEESEWAIEDRAVAAIHVGTDGRVRTACEGFSRTSSAGVDDPMLEDQWALKNTGQSEHVVYGGTAGEDLRMEDTLANGPTGSGVTVAIVDSGLEICHPDLEPNVEEGMSYNFIADLWHGADQEDPFLPTLLEGDHGTSVAGIVAMEESNGIGGRGVAPDVNLRGFNLLALEAHQDRGGEYDIFARELDSLGMSSSNPQSDDVDIFNMSYGSSFGAFKLDTDKQNTFKAGAENLRISDDTQEPLGAIYVLAAGNAFEECDATPDLYDEKQRALFLNGELGCVSANLDPESAWPYVLAVGAFNADGEKSSYSSVGSNLWVAAPGGEDGFDRAGIISADQMGLDRGYATQDEIDLLGTSAKNPEGDYTYMFGGTSSAAPNTVGAAAVVLSAQPELTWRDLKHIFATTARQLDAEIRATRVAFNGKPAVLQHGWITNAAGYIFHNHFGFGAIDLDRAVEMARSITPNNLGNFVQSDPFSQTPTVEIPDHDGAGIILQQTVTGLPNTANIEAVQLRFEITHPRPHDLGLTLISPAGTPSVVNHIFNGVLLDHPTESVDWELLSNAFYGESPNGEWQLNVIDAATGETGMVDSWALVIFYGEHP